MSILSALAITSIVGAATAITGGVVGGIGAIEAHNQQKANAEAQAQQAAYNARLAQRESARIEAENAENVRRQREEAERMRSAQIAALGASGAAISAGSPLAVLGASAARNEQAIQDSAYRGFNAAEQAREQAKMYRYQGAVARASAPSSSALGLNLVANGLNTVGSLASIGGNYIGAKSALKSSGMGGKSFFGGF